MRVRSRSVQSKSWFINGVAEMIAIGLPDMELDLLQSVSQKKP